MFSKRPSHTIYPGSPCVQQRKAFCGVQDCRLLFSDLAIVYTHVLFSMCVCVCVQVFISRGCLHIIPKPRSPAEMTVLPIATPTIREAIKLVGGEFPTEAPPPVQAAIQKKIERYFNHSPSVTFYIAASPSQVFRWPPKLLTPYSRLPAVPSGSCDVT